jgi:hypothetical protein
MSYFHYGGKGTISVPFPGKSNYEISGKLLNQSCEISGKLLNQNYEISGKLLNQNYEISGKLLNQNYQEQWIRQRF